VGLSAQQQLYAAMSAPVPFNVSPEAEQFLMQSAILPDMQPGISYTLGYEVNSLDGELTEEFRGEHFSIGYDTPATWRSDRLAVQVQIAGRSFWIASATLDKLRGKTMTLLRCDVGRGKNAGTLRDTLVAVS
jgi:hypothetical protein